MHTRPSPFQLVGIVLFAAGVAFIAIDVLPFFTGDRDRPLWLNLACLLAPLGLGLVLGATLVADRAEQRAAARQVSGSDGPPAG